MSRLKELTNIWSTIKEIDLRPLRDEALQEVRLVIAGRPGSGRHALADALRNDLLHPGIEAATPVLILNIKSTEEAIQQAAESHLVILLIPADGDVFHAEQLFLKKCSDLGKKVLVFINATGMKALVDQAGDQNSSQKTTLPIGLGLGNAVVGNLEDQKFLVEKLAREIVEKLPDRHIALGRQFPLLRRVICQQLISDTCFSNAAYAFSTGLAEIVPVLNVPLNLTDMVVLTKTQAFLVYKLGLALGMSTRWQEYSREFGGVLGSGFFWRQVARMLIGLIPALGIAPKVAISYAGTYVVGHAVYQWYLTGRHINRKQIQQLYKQSFGRGRKLAKRLDEDQQLKDASRRKLLFKQRNTLICANCGKKNSKVASFCQYCGKKLA